MFCSIAYGTFSRIDHMLEHKTSLNKFKKIEITSIAFYDHSGVKIEINLKKKILKKHAKTWRLNNMLVNNKWVNNEIKEVIKGYLEMNENKDTKSKSYKTQVKQF